MYNLIKKIVLTSVINLRYIYHIYGFKFYLILLSGTTIKGYLRLIIDY